MKKKKHEQNKDRVRRTGDLTSFSHSGDMKKDSKRKNRMVYLFYFNGIGWLLSLKVVSATSHFDKAISIRFLQKCATFCNAFEI